MSKNRSQLKYLKLLKSSYFFHKKMKAKNDEVFANRSLGSIETLLVLLNEIEFNKKIQRNKIPVQSSFFGLFKNTHYRDETHYEALLRIAYETLNSYNMLEIKSKN